MSDETALEEAPSGDDAGSSVDQARKPEVSPRREVFNLSFDGAGMLVGVLFFGLSLLPSLLPRSGLFQGIVSGITLAVGYAVGCLGRWLWNYLGIPVPQEDSRARRVLTGVSVGVVAILTVLLVWQQVGWQNDVRDLFGMESTSVGTWLTILPVTVLFAALLLVVARAIRKLFRAVSRWVDSFLPRRVARVVGVVAVVLLVVTLVNGLLIEGLFSVANQALSVRDTDTPEGIEQPEIPERSGSPESLVEWDTLGRQGRIFTGSGPSVEELNEFSGGGAQEPIRVYAGLRSADSIQERADLVLEELKRTGAFDRDVLVVATTTGTGFLEPNAIESLEFLHNGNTAIAGVQYSYLPSWISILADQEITKETSRVVFDTVHDYWSSLPEGSRPELYLFGLSLGSFGVEAILNSISVLNSPIDGALLAGPPFVNDLWSDLTANRDEESPASLPVYEEGTTVRFTALENALGEPSGSWGDTRLVYLQHASDPITFFSPGLAFNSPEWLEEGQRGPDVSDEMSWVPLVTMWQVFGDLPVAGGVPAGYGHLYNGGEYLDGWIGITEPEDWDDARTAELSEVLDRRAEAREKG